MSYSIGITLSELEDNNEVMRLFSKFKRTLSDKDKEVRWVQPNLWHIELHSLGKLSGTAKNQWINFLQSWYVPESWSEVKIRLQGVGAYPSPEHGRILWLGVQKSQELLDMRAHIVQAFDSFNFSSDARDYNPHLTLAKFRNTLNATDLVQLGGRKHFGDYKPHEIILLETVIQGHMKKYIPVFRKSLFNP